MSKVIFEKHGFAEGKKIDCIYKDSLFGQIIRHSNAYWYVEFEEGLKIISGKILRAIAKKLDKLNHVGK